MSLKKHYSQMEDIPEIGLSDKGDRNPNHKHFYIDIYDAMFSHWNNEPVNLMELGIASGASLLMWATYFTKGIITGLDIVHPVREDYLSKLPNVNMIFADAYDENNDNYLLQNLPKQEIFIEDGAHDVKNQIKAFHKYSKLVRPGGYYICEDLHLQNLGEYLANGVYKINDRNYMLTIYDGHGKPHGLWDDVMIIVNFLN